MNSVCFNGNFLPADTAILTAANRSFRYGDGLFETIKFYKGKILFETFHFERLFLGLKMLQIENSFTAAEFSSVISELCRKNECSDLARVRLAVYRENNNSTSYIIETFPLDASSCQWKENGWRLTLFPFSRKSMDAYSNFKTANFLPYVLAEKYAQQNGFDDALILNASNHICDSSKANLFIIKNGAFFTPALHQGCINGVIRRYLVDSLKANGYRLHQAEITEEQLLDADEAFLTNSIFDLRWVSSYKNKTWPHDQAQMIYKKFIAPLYS